MAKVTVFPENKAPDTDWRWHKTSGSDIIADSGEGYTDKDYCVGMAKREVLEGDTFEVREEPLNV